MGIFKHTYSLVEMGVSWGYQINKKLELTFTSLKGFHFAILKQCLCSVVVADDNLVITLQVNKNINDDKCRTTHG